MCVSLPGDGQAPPLSLCVCALTRIYLPAPAIDGRWGARDRTLHPPTRSVARAPSLEPGRMTDLRIQLGQQFLRNASEKAPEPVASFLRWAGSEAAIEPLTWMVAPPPKARCTNPNGRCVGFTHYQGASDPDSPAQPCAVVVWARTKNSAARLWADKMRELLPAMDALILKEYAKDVSL